MEPFKKKKKKSSSYNLFIIPEGHSKISRFEISRRQVYWLIASSAFLGVSFILSQFGFWYYRVAYTILSKDRMAVVEFDQQKQELLERVSLLEKTVGETESLAGKLASMVGTPRVNLKKGLGPIRAVPVALSHLDPRIEELREKTISLQAKIQELHKLQEDKLNYLASTPSVWPVKGWVTSDFGHRRSPFTFSRDFHSGVDIAAQWGTTIVAPADGVVTYAGYKGGLGKTVIINHGFGITSHFGHNSSLGVNVGQKVKRGMKIAQIGNTGHSTGPHVHYEIHVDGIPVDPMKYILP